MLWKWFFALVFVLCVSLLWIFHLWDTNKMLKTQNCTLQQTLEMNVRVAQEKQERSKDELGRLQKELDGLRKLNHDWSSSPLPDDVHDRLYQICNGHRNACSVAGRADGGL